MIDSSKYLNFNSPLLLGFYYDKENNQIICNYGDKGIIVIPYSATNIEGLIHILEKQHLKINGFRDYLEELNGKYRLNKSSLFLTMIISIITATSLKELDISTLAFCAYIFTIYVGLNYAKSDINYSRTNKILDELDKNELFLQNKDYINSLIENNPEIIYSLKSKFEYIVNFMAENNFKFDINNIDIFNYADMKYIIDTLENEDKEKNNVKTLKK